MSRPRKPSPTSPYRSIASRMSPADELAVAECAAAELRGEWSTALRRHRDVPYYAESQHGGRLWLMSELGDDAPDWLRARHLAAMAGRWEMYGQPRRAGMVLRRLVPLLYPHGVPFEAMGCVHPEQVPSTIFARDWVRHQVDAYDLGGLRELLELPSVAAVSDPVVVSWTRAPMGGWRIVGADGDVMVLAHAASGEEIELLDLGLLHQHPLGTYVLGRVVPTRESPGRLLDWRPLAVEERTAVAVARRPEQWLQVLASGAARSTLPAAFSHLSETSISSDLPQHSWGVLLGHPVDEALPRPPQCLAVDALRAALGLAADPDAVRRQRHLIAELLLDESLDATTLARFALPAYEPAWRTLSAALPPYAARRCEEALWLLSALAPDAAAG